MTAAAVTRRCGLGTAFQRAPIDAGAGKAVTSFCRELNAIGFRHVTGSGKIRVGMIAYRRRAAGSGAPFKASGERVVERTTCRVEEVNHHDASR